MRAKKSFKRSLLVFIAGFLGFCPISEAQAQDSSALAREPFNQYGSGNERFEIIILSALEGYAIPLLKESKPVSPMGFGIRSDSTIEMVSPQAPSDDARLTAIQKHVSSGLKSHRYLAVGFCIIGSTALAKEAGRTQRIIVFLVDAEGNKTSYHVPFSYQEGVFRLAGGWFSETTWNLEFE